MPTPDFETHLNDLAAQGTAMGQAGSSPGVSPRLWQIPSIFPGGVDPQDPEGFRQGCDRSELNDLCIEAYATGATPNGGRFGQVMVAKTAIDHQAAYERALHARHASPLRCRVWAAARRAGHSDLTYGVFGALYRHLQALQDAATAVPNSPDG